MGTADGKQEENGREDVDEGGGYTRGGDREGGGVEKW